jgi:hypothetical protein
MKLCECSSEANQGCIGCLPLEKLNCLVPRKTGSRNAFSERIYYIKVVHEPDKHDFIKVLLGPTIDVRAQNADLAGYTI